MHNKEEDEYMNAKHGFKRYGVACKGGQLSGSMNMGTYSLESPMARMDPMKQEESRQLPLMELTQTLFRLSAKD
jgi:hypothetical protein